MVFTEGAQKDQWNKCENSESLQTQPTKFLPGNPKEFSDGREDESFQQREL